MAGNELGLKEAVISMKALQWVFGGKGQRTCCCSGHILFDLGSDESAVCGLVV